MPWTGFFIMSPFSLGYNHAVFTRHTSFSLACFTFAFVQHLIYLRLSTLKAIRGHTGALQRHHFLCSEFVDIFLHQCLSGRKCCHILRVDAEGLLLCECIPWLIAKTSTTMPSKAGFNIIIVLYGIETTWGGRLKGSWGMPNTIRTTN